MPGGWRCCCECCIHCDEFDGPGVETTTLAGWTETSGSWEIKSIPYWVAQITGAGELTSNTIWGYSESPSCYIQAKLYNVVANSKVHLKLSGATIDLYAEFFFEAAQTTVSIYRDAVLVWSDNSYGSYVGGTATMIFLAGPYGDPDCDKMSLAAGVPEDTCELVWDTVERVEGPWEMSVEVFTAGIVYKFDYINWVKQAQVMPECYDCDCFFQNGDYPEPIQRTLTATASSDCPAYDGLTWSLSDWRTGSPSDCRAWTPGSNETPCSYYAVAPGLKLATPNDDLSDFHLLNLGTGGVLTWSISGGPNVGSTICPLYLVFGPFDCSKAGETDCGADDYYITVTE